MALENGRATFSLRLPAGLAVQIDARAKVNRRNRNAEIILLLERALDMMVERDKELLKGMQERPITC